MRSGQFVQEKLQFVKDLCKNTPVTDDLGTPEASNAPTALLSFIAQNVRSYRDEVFFSLEATRLANDEVVHSLGIAGLKNPVKVLPAAGIFGANASGKSQLLRAMSDMRSIVINSFRRGDRTTGIRRRPFLLDEEAHQQPSRYEVELILKGVRWRYGFEVDDKRVLGEYAHYYPNGRAALVFNRDFDEVRFGSSFRTVGRTLIPLMRENALMVSVAAAASSEDISPLFEWFLNNLRLVDPRSRESRALFTSELASHEDMRQRVLNLLKAADLGIVDIRRSSPDPETEGWVRRWLSVIKEDFEFEDSETSIDLENVNIPDSVNLVHKGVSKDIELDLEDESNGTMVWFGMIGPLLEALDQGFVILVDELGGSLHPDLVEQIIDLFQNMNSNPQCAQLIFNSHDVTILERRNTRYLGRDQAWLTEKLNGSTTLLSIAEFKTRNTEALDRRYLEGRFGGVPRLIPGEFAEAAEIVKS